MNWRPTRIKYLCVDAGQYGLNISADAYSDSGTRLIRTSDINSEGLLRPSEEGVHVDVKLQDRHVLRPGDLLLSRSGTLGRVFSMPDISEVSTFAGYLVRFRPRTDVDARFLAYLATSSPFQDAIQGDATTSTIQNFNAERYANIPAIAPPLEEQRRIADFLDVEAMHIAELSSARRHQLSLMDERETTRVYDAICGIGESEKFRNSGLRWLGEIPASWPVSSVASQFDVELGKMLNEERARGSHRKAYLRNTNVQWDSIDTEDLLSMDFPPHERTRYEVLPGDLLICEGGEPGRAAIWDGRISEIYYQKALHRARARGHSLVRWLYYCLRAATALNVFAVEGNTTTIAHLTGQQLRAHHFPFPPRSVQRRIICKLDEIQAKERYIRFRLQQQQELLGERRQALITAAVTGQLDVTTARSGVR